MGQFATPASLALEIARSARAALGQRLPIAFLDPAFGTGAFYSALRRAFASDAIASAQGYEVDAYYGDPARRLWAPTGFNLALRDFTAARPSDNGASCADLLICNPPYVRHHHISRSAKRRLATDLKKDLGIGVSGLAGLYVYFMLLSHKWLRPECLSIWLVPSEFMDVNYGSVLRRYLLEQVDLVRIHRFDPAEVQFDDALVSSAVVWFSNRPPSPAGDPEFTFGGSIATPKIRRRIGRGALRDSPKWTGHIAHQGRQLSASHSLNPWAPAVGHFFSIRRGIVTGANRFFLLDASRASKLPIPSRILTPILPSPRNLGTDVVNADADGQPLLDGPIFLFDCRLAPADLARVEPETAAYVATGEAANIHKGYLTLRRDPWT